jgi:hypothetical protein
VFRRALTGSHHHHHHHQHRYDKGETWLLLLLLLLPAHVQDLEVGITSGSMMTMASE